MVGVMESKGLWSHNSFQRIYARTIVLSALIPQQTTVDPHLCQRLLDTHKQVWLSVSWGHCSFLLAPSAHKVLFVPSKLLCPPSCVSSVIKSHWPPKSNSLEVLSPFASFPGWEICCGSRTFLAVQELHWFIQLSGRRQWHPTPVLLPGKSHGQRSLVGYSPWGR